ncbi:hypothetical protein [Tunicatimonas pelagia]|uniref:hypothetical protein n=1 Tax=Tunicatimonas pelagia TaxID=931531 RepID=UPI00266718D1|nr:hypothetical protein [Tunicatimonas pelagia]WKN43061.1 hypothetical protein P0M28_28900 [Tunicatimonas pelagia]
MTTQVNNNPALLIDTEFAAIPYSESTLQLNERLGIRRSTTPFSGMETGKFRKLFNRHTTAFRRR